MLTVVPTPNARTSASCFSQMPAWLSSADGRKRIAISAPTVPMSARTSEDDRRARSDSVRRIRPDPNVMNSDTVRGHGSVSA